MDYCSSCRRHLNGALVCPGCGAYAPDIAPNIAPTDILATRPTAPGAMATGSMAAGPPERGAATGTDTGSLMLPAVPGATAAPAVWEYETSGGMWHDGHAALEPSDLMGEFTPQPTHAGLPAGTEGAAGTAETAALAAVEGATARWTPGAGDVDGLADNRREADGDFVNDVNGVNGVEDVEGVPVAPQGRAARRRQMARWKKNQRKAVVATAVALVGGGLTVMGMDRQGADRTQAAAAPDADNLGELEEQGSQYGRTPATQPDDVRRTEDTSGSRSPTTDGYAYDGYDQSGGGTSNSSRDNGTSPQTSGSTPSTQKSRTADSSNSGGTSEDDSASSTPSTEATTPPATDDSGTESGTDTGSDSGTETGGDTSTGSDSGSSSDTGGSDSSGDTSDATSPSGLCLLGGVLCVS
ncbi:SCO2400 family protein [Streptomyces sp. NPDC002643]